MLTVCPCFFYSAPSKSALIKLMSTFTTVINIVSDTKRNPIFNKFLTKIEQALSIALWR